MNILKWASNGSVIKITLIVGLIVLVGTLGTEVKRQSKRAAFFKEQMEITLDESKVVGVELESKYKEVLIDFCSTNKTTYYIRNELLYWDMLTKNNELDLFEGSYRAILIHNKAIEQGIDPYLAISLAIQEDKGRHNIKRNSKNAVGMFQLTPIVEKIYNIKGEILEENVTGAMKFLADLKRMYRGNMELVLAHYNAGSWPQKKLNEDFGGVRGYVDEILSRYELMSKKYRVVFDEGGKS